jgi:hypothetical protein
MKSDKAATKVLVREPKPISEPNPKRTQVQEDRLAARRHRKSTESFVKSGQVEDAARDAEPKTPVEEVELFNAERIGEARSKGDSPASGR